MQKKAEAPKYLRQQAEREWREIHDGTLRFSRVEQDIAALGKLTKSDLLTFYQVRIHQLTFQGHHWVCTRRVCTLVKNDLDDVFAVPFL